MNNVKQIDMIRKRNTELVKQLDDLKFQLEFNSQLNMNGYRHAKDLINDLEKIKQDWLLALDDLNNKRMEYSKLISDLQKIKNIMIDNKFKIFGNKKLIKSFKK
jgi:hypothetical protein